MRNTAKPSAIVFAVVVTMITTAVAFNWVLEAAKERHRSAYHLAPRQAWQLFVGDYMVPADVALFDLDRSMILVLMAFLVLYPVAHVFIGRAVSAVTHALCVKVSQVFGFKPRQPSEIMGSDIGAWSLEGKVISGALWPLTGLAIPALLIALLFGALYRTVWTV